MYTAIILLFRFIGKKYNNYLSITFPFFSYEENMVGKAHRGSTVAETKVAGTKITGLLESPDQINKVRHDFYCRDYNENDT